MRNAFAREITRLAKGDERIVLLAADIGNKLFDDFKLKCPGRFFNCGVAEANMIGMAAGMALSGLRPVCYTIAPFITYRCLEQIRVDVCYHHVPVVLVGTGSGLAYASLGATHHSCEEMGMLRLLPHLAVVAPGDSFEVTAATRAAVGHADPVYIRIGKKDEPVVHASEPPFAIGKAIRVRGGRDVCFLSNGAMLPVVIAAADLLVKEGLSPEIHSFHTVKPLDETTLHDLFPRHRIVATVEEHGIAGGLGGSVAEWLADHPFPNAALLRFGTSGDFWHETGEQEHAREHFGLTAPAIAARVKSALASVP